METNRIFLKDLDLEFLRPPVEVLQVKHSRNQTPSSLHNSHISPSYHLANYICTGEGKKMIRKIFHKVEFTQFEKEQIALFV